MPVAGDLAPVGVAGDVALQLLFRLGMDAGEVGAALAPGRPGLKFGHRVAPDMLAVLHVWPCGWRSPGWTRRDG